VWELELRCLIRAEIFIFRILRMPLGATQLPIPGLAKGFEGACPNCLQISKKILSRAHGNFEAQNKVLDSSIKCYKLLHYY